MNKFKDISSTVMIILTLAVIIQVYIYYDKDYKVDKLASLDINQDGVVSRKELKYYLKLLNDKKHKKLIKFNDVLTSSLNGAARGLLMGLILQDFQGGLVLGLMLGVLNPLLANSDKLLFN